MKHKGFTLVEILVAMTILGIVLAMLAGTFRMAIQTWERGEEIVEENEKGRLSYEQLAQDLRSAFLSRENDEAAFEGESDEISFVCTIQGPITPYLAWRRVSYFLEEEKGLFMREDFPESITPERAEPRPALLVDPQVSELSFRYLGFPDEERQEGEWVESWSSSDEERLPRAVEVSLRYGHNEQEDLEESTKRSFLIFLPVDVAGEGMGLFGNESDEEDEFGEEESGLRENPFGGQEAEE